MKTPVKRGNAADCFMVFCFVGFLLLAMTVTLLRGKDDFSFYENRNLAPLPEWTEENVLSGEYTAGLERYLADHAAGRSTLLKLNTAADLYLLHRPVVNGVVIAGDGLFLPWNDYEAVDARDVAARAETMAENLAGVAQLVSSYGGQYLYVGVPCQYASHEDSYPGYLNSRAEYTALSTALFADAMEKSRVPYLDMGPVFDALDRPEAVSSLVDNHYSMEGAYLTYRGIMERVNAAGYDLDILREGDYTLTQLPNPYLGSRLRKLCGLPESAERLSILTPNVPVPFSRSDYGRPFTKDASVYELPQNDTNPVLYRLYMGGDLSHSVIDTNRPALPSILVYGDSFTNAAECILYYGFDKMYSLDLRYYDEQSLAEFLRQYRPEVVVCIRDYEALLAPFGNGAGVD